MSTIRLYAAPIVLLVWAALIELVGSSSTQLVIIRLVTFAVALVVSIRELNGRHRERVR